VSTIPGDVVERVAEGLRHVRGCGVYDAEIAEYHSRGSALSHTGVCVACRRIAALAALEAAGYTDLLRERDEAREAWCALAEDVRNELACRKARAAGGVTPAPCSEWGGVPVGPLLALLRIARRVLGAEEVPRG